MKHVVFVTYRVVVALFCIAYIIRTGFYHTKNSNEDSTKWFIYLTDWGFALLTLHFLWSAGTAVHHAITAKSSTVPQRQHYSANVPMRWFHGVGWFLFNGAVNLSLLVTILFWVLLYPSSGGNTNSVNSTSNNSSGSAGFSQDAGQDVEVNIVMHTINSVLSLADVFFSATPIRILHGVYTMVIASVYAVFTIIYWAAGGTNTYNGQRYIYPVLDYSNKPNKATLNIVLSVFVALPLVQLFTYGCFRLRDYLTKRCNSQKYCLPTSSSDGIDQLEDLISSKI